MLELKRSASTRRFEDFANVGIRPINAQASDKHVARTKGHIQFKATVASERSQESRISYISTGLKGLKGFLRLAPTER